MSAILEMFIGIPGTKNIENSPIIFTYLLR